MKTQNAQQQNGITTAKWDHKIVNKLKSYKIDNIETTTFAFIDFESRKPAVYHFGGLVFYWQDFENITDGQERLYKFLAQIEQGQQEQKTLKRCAWCGLVDYNSESFCNIICKISYYEQLASDYLRKIISQAKTEQQKIDMIISYRRRDKQVRWTYSFGKTEQLKKQNATA